VNRTNAAVELPTKPLEYRAAQMWVDQHNPFPEDSVEAALFEADFWTDQASLWDQRVVKYEGSERSALNIRIPFGIIGLLLVVGGFITYLSS
jgi:hypothetical protein